MDMPAVGTQREHPSDAAAIADVLFRRSTGAMKTAERQASAFETGQFGPRVNLRGGGRTRLAVANRKPR